MAANTSPRKPGSPSGRPSAGKPAAAGTSGSQRGGATSTGRTGGRPTGGSATPPKRRPSKSIVAKKARPWGLIITCIVVAVFAIAVVGFAIAKATDGNRTSANDPYRMPEVPSAKAIKGVTFKVEPNHTHVTTAVKYDTTPPTGGNHSQIWVDCSGTVYPNALANENAVHGLEHGAIWITYRPGLAQADVAALAKLVTGQNYTFMSPYPGLKSPVSLQAWGYQLFVDKASDARIPQFISALRNLKTVSPEYPGNCSNPAFKAKPSTFGNPIFSES